MLNPTANRSGKFVHVFRVYLLPCDARPQQVGCATIIGATVEVDLLQLASGQLSSKVGRTKISAVEKNCGKSCGCTKPVIVAVTNGRLFFHRWMSFSSSPAPTKSTDQFRTPLS